MMVTALWEIWHARMWRLIWQLNAEFSVGYSLLLSPRRAWSFIFRRCGIFVKCAINQGTQCNWNANYSCLFRYQLFCYSISSLNTFVTVDFESILIQLPRISPKIIWYGQSPKPKQFTIKVSEASEGKWAMETLLQITTQLYLDLWLFFKFLKWVGFLISFLIPPSHRLGLACLI